MRSPHNNNNRKKIIIYNMKKYSVFLMAILVLYFTGCEDEVGTGVDGPPEKAQVSGVSLEKNSLVKMVGQWEMLVHTVYPLNAGNKAVTWVSSNPSVVEIDNMGDMLAKDIGTATITVTTVEGNFSATCEVVVNPFVGNPVEGVKFEFETLTIETARRLRFTPVFEPVNATDRRLIWETDNESVATITPTGILNAVGPGTATIKITARDGGFTATTEITVTEDFLVEDFEWLNVGLEIPWHGFDGSSQGKVSVAMSPQDVRDAPVGLAQVGPGKVGFIHGSVVNGTYGDMGSMQIAPRFEVKLPEGKRVSDYSHLTFDAYVYRGKDTDSQGRTLGDAETGCGWFGGGVRIRINSEQGGSSTSLRMRGALTFVKPGETPDDNGAEWNTRMWARNIRMDLSEIGSLATVANLNEFSLVVGTASNYAVYCIDNVILRK